MYIIFFYLEKYDYVGRLLKPGEPHSYYTDEEESPTNKLHLENPKQLETEKPKDDGEGNFKESPKPVNKNKETIDKISGDVSLDNSNEKLDLSSTTECSSDPAEQDENHEKKIEK